MGQDISNAIGRGLNIANSVIALRNGQFTQQQAAQALALNNPQVRAGLVGHPFQAGGLGLSGQQGMLPTVQPPNPADNAIGAQPAQVNVPQYAWQPNLPAMDPTTALKQAQSQDFLNLQQTNPALFHGQSGYASPLEAGQIIGAAPDQVANTTVSRSGVGYYAQPIPWNLMMRGEESGAMGNPTGPPLLTPSAVRQQQGGGVRTLGQQPAPSAEGVRANVPAGGMRLDPTTIDVLTEAGFLPRNFKDNASRAGFDVGAGQAAAAPSPTTTTTTPTAPPPTTSTLPSGYQPFDINKLGKEPIVSTAPTAAAAPPAAPPTAAPAPTEAAASQIGFPPPLDTGPVVPTVRGRTFGPARLETQSQVTTPFGKFGTKTDVTKEVNPAQDYADAVAKLAAKGIPDPLANRIDVIRIGANAFDRLISQYAAQNAQGQLSLDPMKQYVGPGTYAAQKGIARIPFADVIAQTKRDIMGQGEPTKSGGQFRALLEGLGIPARTLAGAAFTETERELYGPSFIPRGDLPWTEFKQYIRAYGHNIRVLAENTLNNYPTLAPDTQQQLAQIVQNYQGW